jgi:hypothetical protein
VKNTHETLDYKICTLRPEGWRLSITVLAKTPQFHISYRYDTQHADRMSIWYTAHRSDVDMIHSTQIGCRWYTAHRSDVDITHSTQIGCRYDTQHTDRMSIWYAAHRSDVDMIHSHSSHAPSNLGQFENLHKRIFSDKRFQAFAVVWIINYSLWDIARRLKFLGRRFGPPFRFHFLGDKRLKRQGVPKRRPTNKRLGNNP